MSRGWAGGSTRRWRRDRALCLAENQATNRGRCRAGLDGTRPCPRHPQGGPGGAPCSPCTGVATQAHHPHGQPTHHVPWWDLEALCGPCNGHLGDPLAHQPRHRPITRW